MWISFTDAFLSVVAHRNRPADLLVRARVAGDIERVFPDAVVTENRYADYRFRAIISRDEVAAVLARRITDIAYDNFKNAVPDTLRRDAYYECWRAMRDLQNRSC